MADAAPGAGDVIITLDGKEFTMTPSMEACLAISKMGGGGGAAAVIRRCNGLDFETICDVVAVGTGYVSGPQRSLIAKAVYQTGTIPIAADCIDFIRIVNNGGQPPNDEEGEPDGEDPLSSASQLENSITA